jgi:hypothetical protein
MTWTLVQTPAIMTVFLSISRTVWTKSSLSHALTPSSCYVDGVGSQFVDLGHQTPS